MRDDVDTAGARGRHDGREHVFEVVAGEHRAVAVISIVEQSRFGRPGEGHRPAAELNCIGEMRGIEHGCLERLFEAVHVDQDVASAAGLREKIADFSGHRFDPINTMPVRPRRATGGYRPAAPASPVQRSSWKPAPARTRASRARRSQACVWLRRVSAAKLAVILAVRVPPAEDVQSLL